MNLPEQQGVFGLQKLEQACYLQGMLLTAAEAEERLFPLLASPYWGVRTKTLITLGRVCKGEAAPLLLAWLQQQGDPCLQLQALDSWAQLPLGIAEQQQTIARLLPWATSPITLRGLVCLCSQIGGLSALTTLAELLSSPAAKVVSDEVLWLAWLGLIKRLSPSQQRKAEAFVDTQPKLQIWLKYREEPQDLRLSFYPSPEYLWQVAAAEGLSRQEYKQLYFKIKNKKHLKGLGEKTEKGKKTTS